MDHSHLDAQELLPGNWIDITPFAFLRIRTFRDQPSFLGGLIDFSWCLARYVGWLHFRRRRWCVVVLLIVDCGFSDSACTKNPYCPSNGSKNERRLDDAKILDAFAARIRVIQWIVSYIRIQIEVIIKSPRRELAVPMRISPMRSAGLHRVDPDAHRRFDRFLPDASFGLTENPRTHGPAPFIL